MTSALRPNHSSNPRLPSGSAVAPRQRPGGWVGVGDGWLVSSVTPDEVRHGCDIVFATAAQHQRTIEDDHIGVLLAYYISPDGPKAVSKAASFVTRQRPDVPFTAFSAVGTTATLPR